MKVSTINLATLVGCVVLAAAVAVWAPGQPDDASRAPVSPLSGLPAGAAFVATVDLSRLRQSELGASLAGAGREVPGLGRLEDVCGFDPTSQIERLALALPHAAEGANGRSSDFGLAAAGRFDSGRMAECARAVIARRGGAPVVSQIGTFVSVRDRTGKSTGEIAVRETGLVLVGGGAYLRNMIDAADGRIPSLLGDELHRALRREVGNDGAVVATWVPPAGWLERWLGLDESADTPWTHVRAAGLQVDLSAGLRARMLVGCATPQACRKMAQALESLRSDIAAPAAGASPLAAMVERTRIESAQREVRVQVRLTPDEVALLLDAARVMLGWSGAGAPIPTAASTPRPDEVVRPPAATPNSGRDDGHRSSSAAAVTGSPRRIPRKAASGESRGTNPGHSAGGQ